MKNEIEATFLSVNKDLARAKLKAVGFELKTSEYLMRRKTFDFSRVAPGQNKWGRVRQESDKVTMTVKEIRGSGINDTYEVELVVNDFDTACAFFEACGIPAEAFQENMREVWVRVGFYFVKFSESGERAKIGGVWGGIFAHSQETLANFLRTILKAAGLWIFCRYIQLNRAGFSSCFECCLLYRGLFISTPSSVFLVDIYFLDKAHFLFSENHNFHKHE